MEQKMQDITAPEEVEILIRQDGTVIWVNINGMCALRACQIKRLVVEDMRQPHDMDTETS